MAGYPFPQVSQRMRDDVENPPYHYFSDLDVVYWRNNWSDPNATALAFRSGPPAGHHITKLYPVFPEWKPGLGHAHPDAGSFILFANGSFLANDTGYAVKETRWHNSITVDHTGQNHSGTAWSTFEKQAYSRLDRIRQENVWLSPLVAASTAVFEDAYDPNMGIQEMRRHLIMIDGRFLVIRDDIRSTKKHSYQWFLHTDQLPQNTGPDRWNMTNGNARLLINNLNSVETSRIEPTMVETQIYTGPSRLQQRGFHLELDAPDATNFQFLTAFCIQSSTDSDSRFVATKSGSGRFELSSGTHSVTIWIGNQPDLNGSFGFVLREAQKIVAIGLSGRSLKTEAGTLKLPSNGQLTIHPATGSSWIAEAQAARGWSFEAIQ